MIVILGPTASGKTHLATHLAYRLGGEIISADSRQVYRGMNLGTGKDLNEYSVNGQAIPYHLIDILEAGATYNVYQFQQDVVAVITQIRNRGRIPILCGGSGMYLQAVLQQLPFTAAPVNPALRSELDQLSNDTLHERFQRQVTDYTRFADLSTRKRTIRAIEIGEYLATLTNSLPLPTLGTHFQAYGLNPPVSLRRERISHRLHERLKAGLVDEVQGLLSQGILPEQLIYYGLEYKFVTQYLIGEIPYDHMVQRLETEIHRYAKRQMTYFRKMERDGIAINWLDYQHTTSQWVETIITQL